MWYFYGQRRSEGFKKAVEGALKFFPEIKVKPELELCFQSLVYVVKRKDILGVWKSRIYPASTKTSLVSKNSKDLKVPHR